MKRAIITGPTGAIGMALLKYLLEMGVEVLVLVRPDSERLKQLPVHENLRVVKIGLEHYETISNDMEEIGKKTYDVMFHFAWGGTIGAGRDDMYLQNQNVKYTLDAVRLAKRLGCTTFLGAGSQAEYGRVATKIKATTPVNPETGYGIAKLCAGQMSRLECRKLEMKHIWVRILSVYGPYDGQATMITSGILKMLRGETPAFSKGEQQWDYIYSRDAARALFLAAEKGTDGKIYPVGTGQIRPLYEYIEAMRDAVGDNASVDIGKLAYREQQVMYLCADIRELTRDTGFKPEISFEEGIRETVAWCKSLLKE